MNSQRSAYLCLLSAGIKGVCHQPSSFYTHFKISSRGGFWSLAWWCMLAISLLWKLRQEGDDFEFQDSLGYRVRPWRGQAQCWEDSSGRLSACLTSTRPQSLYKQHKACCMPVIPALGKVRQVESWDSVTSQPR